LGVTRKALINKPLTRFILLEDEDIYYFLRKSLFDTGLPRECELRMIMADNTPLWVRLEASVGQDSEGSPLGRLSISDISERKKNEQQLADYSDQLEEKVAERTRELRESQEKLLRQERLAALGQLAGGVGHELRNPLGVISNAIYILGETLPQADEKAREYLGIITDELHRAEKIITDLLDFARIRVSEKQAISLGNMISEALARFKAPDKVKVKVEMAEDLPKAFADPGQMSQVLGNLLLNAYQAMPEGGEVKLTGNLKENNGQPCLALEVEDSGCGISSENMAKLFEPLFTTKPRGIGLGLPTSKTLVEGNGGEIEVSSLLGKGSVFTIYLPIVQE
jgi:signal transduction histidine kinase